MHIGPHNVARAERGVTLERLRGDIAEVVRKLAVYVRARLDAVAGGADPIVADPIVGGVDNGECTGPSKGRRGEVRGDG